MVYSDVPALMVLLWFVVLVWCMVVVVMVYSSGV